MIWGKEGKLYNILLKSKQANSADISRSYYIGGNKSGVNSQTTSINKYPSDKELANMRISELKHTGLKAIQFYSELLKDYFYFAIDESIIPELIKENVPIYTETEIRIMLDAKDDQERKQLHAFKKIFCAKIYKAKGR